MEAKEIKSELYLQKHSESKLYLFVKSHFSRTLPNHQECASQFQAVRPLIHHMVLQTSVVDEDHQLLLVQGWISQKSLKAFHRRHRPRHHHQLAFLKGR